MRHVGDGGLHARSLRRVRGRPSHLPHDCRLHPARDGRLLRGRSAPTGASAGAPTRCRQKVEPLTAALRTRVRGELAVGAEEAGPRAALASPIPVLVRWEHTGNPPA
ncbi:hypothetical protein ACFH04_06635 [Streptomyces noboritoensis]|uniref:Uncharacterized protein n=1 Tax=Streptomyces noboritoensis TaxID=67337 RepID=A0ABV6T9R0_9ACTN